MQPERPYQDYVENEAERYWQEMVKVGNLTKPDLQEIRAGATPVLGLAQRYRPGPKLNPALNRAQQAVDAMQLHALEQGWIKPPYSRLQMSPNYVEALVQLADDADWLAREIPLPDHPPPKHPPDLLYDRPGNRTARTQGRQSDTRGLCSHWGRHAAHQG